MSTESQPTSAAASTTAPWIRISEAPAHVGQVVEVRGWLVHRRSSGKVQFLVVRDGSGEMQCVAGVRDITAEQWEASGQLTQESSLMLNSRSLTR